MNLRQRGAGGHERTTNSVDLFRFQVGRCIARRLAYCVGSATYRSRVGLVWGTVSLQRARRGWPAAHFFSMLRALKAEGRGVPPAPCRLTFGLGDGVKNPIPPLRPPPAAAWGGSADLS